MAELSNERVSSRASRPWGRLLLGLLLLGFLALLPWLQVGDGTVVPQTALFLGRFHPLVLHVPIVLLLLALAFEAARWPLLHRLLPSASPAVEGFVLTLGAIGASVSVLAGWMLAAGGGYDEHLLGEHFQSGLWAAAGGALAMMLHALQPIRASALLRFALGVTLLATAGATFVAGHHGASLTHGEDFLTEHAPDRLRQLVGLPVRTDPNAAAMKPPAEREVYAEVVAPILAERCTGCHNAQKAKGGLRLDRLDLALKGGESGPSIKPGNETDSLLLSRVQLPLDDKDHMPPKGKPQLADDDVALLAWWIKSGAPDKQKAGDLKPPETILLALERRVPDEVRQRLEQAKRARAQQIETRLAAVRAQLPGRLKAVVPGEPDLAYSAGAQAQSVKDEQVRLLATFGRDLVELDLQHTAVTDSGLAALTNLPGLAKLELQSTGVGDAGLVWLRGLTNLEVISLFDTKVTDAGLRSVTNLPRLRRVYAAQTPVTAAGADLLKKARPGVDVILAPRVPVPAATNAPVAEPPKSPMKKGAKA